MYIFSNSTSAQLLKAGWQPGRSVTTLPYRLTLSVEGYPWFPAVEQFLREFGGLRLTFSYEDASVGTFHFDACQAASEVDILWAQNDYAQRIGNSTLCVIGQAYSDHMSLYMDNAGKVYGGFDDFLCLIADSGKASIEAICRRLPVQEIPEIPK